MSSALTSDFRTILAEIKEYGSSELVQFMTADEASSMNEKVARVVVVQEDKAKFLLDNADHDYDEGAYLNNIIEINFADSNQIGYIKAVWKGDDYHIIDILLEDDEEEGDVEDDEENVSPLVGQIVKDHLEVEDAQTFVISDSWIDKKIVGTQVYSRELSIWEKTFSEEEIHESIVNNFLEKLPPF